MIGQGGCELLVLWQRWCRGNGKCSILEVGTLNMPSIGPPRMIGNKWDCIVTVHGSWPAVKCVRDDDDLFSGA